MGFVSAVELAPASAPPPSSPQDAARGWDLRAAVCSVASENLRDYGDEVLVFLLRDAMDPHTRDEIFAELFRRFHLRVIAWCNRITRDAEHAVDLAQEVFLRAYRRLDTYRGDSRFSTWLYSITRNHCLNALKKRGIEPTERGEMLSMNLQGSTGADLQTALERDQSFRNMWRLIRETLTPTEARIMALHYGHGLPLAVITRRMMLTNASGAKAYIVSARRKLNAVLRGVPPKERRRAARQPSENAALAAVAGGA